jgi:F-type H+-transporting ATPase subunit alpha
VREVGRFEKALLQHLRNNQRNLLATIRDDDQKIAGDIEKKIRGVLDEFAKTFA